MGDDLILEGNVGGEGDLHVDGRIRGDVRVGRFTLGEGGCVEGSVTADTVEVRGRVIGSISARSVRLHAGANVEGDITHEELTVDAGAAFQGRSLRRGLALQASAEVTAVTAAPLLAIASTPS
jgi:cytoskeletal protein CcmA (bactofilin family)